MIYITGDIHGDIDIRKPTNQNFPQQRLMTKMIILLSAETLVYFGRIHPQNIIGCGGTLINF